MICSTIRSIRLKNSWIICNHQNWILFLSIVDLLAAEGKRPCKLCKKLCWIHLGFFFDSAFLACLPCVFSTILPQQKTQLHGFLINIITTWLSHIFTAYDICRVTSPDLFGSWGAVKSILRGSTWVHMAIDQWRFPSLCLIEHLLCS